MRSGDSSFRHGNCRSSGWKGRHLCFLPFLGRGIRGGDHVEQITRRVIEKAPGLEVIGQHGVGADNIDIEAAAEQGVLVVNVPAGSFMSF